MRLLPFLACLSLMLCGCVSTTITTPEGLTVERVAVYSDFTVKASRKADGSLSVEETQAGAADAANILLDLIKQAATRSP